MCHVVSCFNFKLLTTILFALLFYSLEKIFQFNDLNVS